MISRSWQANRDGKKVKSFTVKLFTFLLRNI